MFRRLYLSYLALVGLSTGILALSAGLMLRHTILEDRRAALQEEARLARDLLREDASGIRALAERLECRITIIAEDGRVLADTHFEPSRLRDQRLHPEVIEAASRESGTSVRKTELTGEETMFAAVRMDARFLRLAQPMRPTHDRLDALYRSLALTAGVLFALAAILGYFFARRHAAPLVELSRMAGALARGELERRSYFEAKGEVGVLRSTLNDMAESLARMMAQAEKDKEELLVLLSSMSEGVIAVDRSGRITLTNPAAAYLLDFRAQDARDRALWDVVRDEQVIKAAEEVLEKRVKKTVETALRGRDLHLSLVPLPAGLVLVATDVSEAARYPELRKEFVANVSHELRTPLTFIRGFLETLRDGAWKDPVKAPEYLATIDKHAAHLLSLVNSLLELSRLEARPGLRKSVPVDLADLLRRVADDMKPAAERKRQSLAVEAATVPAVPGDPEDLERAVSNVIDNAIKYTPEGGSIRATARPEEGAVVIEVTDTGIGIPAEDLPRIFERFYRVEKSRSREMGGTGLGLAIVKHVVQAHRGTVEAVSEVGKGTTLRMRLPAT